MSYRMGLAAGPQEDEGVVASRDLASELEFGQAWVSVRARVQARLNWNEVIRE